MQNVMISVIVPVYNAQAYLDLCIQSVLTQSFRDLELILINDGSTDDSLEKCLRWAHDPRVTVISTENRGVSYARNIGLQQACGKWILFLDSDDYLLDGCLEPLMAMATPEVQEIVASYVDTETRSQGILHQCVSAEAVRRMSLDNINNQLLPEFYEVKPLALCACWSKLYRNDVIQKNAVRFHEELRLSEDTLFNLEYLACIDHVVISNLPVTFYRQNTTSVTKVFHAGQLANRFHFFDLLKDGEFQDAPVHVMSLLLFEVCKIERYAGRNERKLLENEIIGYLSENTDTLRRVGKRCLSRGKWQRLAYRTAVTCFQYKAYGAGFAVLRAYAAATQGEIKGLTTNK